MGKVSDKRFKLTYFGLSLFLIEGIMKLIFKSFPLTEVFSAQVALAVAYITNQSILHAKEVRYGKNNQVAD